MSAPATQSKAAPVRPVGNPAEGEALMRHMMQIMDELLGLIEQETALIRVGKLNEAKPIEARKTELSGLYLNDVGRFKSAQVYLDRIAPKLTAELRHRHDLFRAVLQMNLTVLATAHAVSESIMRGVSAELARKATPGAYGASGRATKPGASAMLPLTVSRVL